MPDEKPLDVDPGDMVADIASLLPEDRDPELPELAVEAWRNEFLDVVDEEAHCHGSPERI